MAVPGFQAFMLPLLRQASDGLEHQNRPAFDQIGRAMGLEETDLSATLPNGLVIYEYRLHWAKTHLVKAGLLVATGRARFRITEAGKAALGTAPDPITRVWLASQYPAFAEWKAGSRRKRPGPEVDVNHGLIDGSDVQGPETTPREAIEIAYRTLRVALAADLLEAIQRQTPFFFERLVVELLVAMGYGGSLDDAGRAFQTSGDGGVDGVIKEDRLGLGMVHVQAKRWAHPVGRPEVQAFAGSLMGFKGNKGVFITTSTFTKEAKEYAHIVPNLSIALIDGEELAQLMIDHDIGVSRSTEYVLKQIDSDYFEGAD